MTIIRQHSFNINEPGQSSPYATADDLTGGSVGQIFRLVSRNSRAGDANVVGAFPTTGTFRRDPKSGKRLELVAMNGVEFDSSIAELHHVSTSELCNIYGDASDDIDVLDQTGRTGVAFRAAHRYATSKGYVGGFPNFETWKGVNGIVVLNKSGPDGKIHVDFRDYTPQQIGLGSNSNAYDAMPWRCINSVRNALSEEEVNGETWDFAFPDFESSGSNNGCMVISYAGV